MASVEERVKQIIVEQLGVDEAEVTPTASFVDDLGADSLDQVELVMAFEEAFGIEVPDEDAEKMTTVKDAIEYIDKHSRPSKPQGIPASRSKDIDSPGRRYGRWIGLRAGHRDRGKLEEPRRRAERRRPESRILIPPSSIARSRAK